MHLESLVITSEVVLYQRLAAIRRGGEVKSRDHRRDRPPHDITVSARPYDGALVPTVGREAR